jgi:hypothetical protein
MMKRLKNKNLMMNNKTNKKKRIKINNKNYLKENNKRRRNKTINMKFSSAIFRFQQLKTISTNILSNMAK